MTTNLNDSALVLLTAIDVRLQSEARKKAKAKADELQSLLETFGAAESLQVQGMLLAVVDSLERQLAKEYAEAAAEELAERLVTPPFDFQFIADEGIAPFGMGSDRWYGPDGCGCEIDVSLPREVVLHHPIDSEHPEALPGTGTSRNPIPQPETNP